MREPSENPAWFSWGRFLAVVRKEFVQMMRDRVTFAMMIGIPILQTILFGYAINSDPRHLPTAVLSADQSPFSRNIVAALQNSRYFRLVRMLDSHDQARLLLDRGEVQFVLTVPEQFARRLLRGERPVLLLEADASDPAATSNAVAALQPLVTAALARDLTGPLAHLAEPVPAVEIRIQPRFNPEAITQFNIVPGLLGVVLTMTLVIITSLAVTRERERGTMESLLATPVTAAEVMFGKILPYIIVGYLQLGFILAAAHLLFRVPLAGSLPLLLFVSLPFIAANLGVGLTFSTLARNQLQAVQMSVFFFLPSILLSGFMFPFRGMPRWAQFVGEALPLTHYLRIVRGILLKGNGLFDFFEQLWPIALFLLFSLATGLTRYRRTLD
jgi:ABC-2 type transport system permease protein